MTVIYVNSKRNRNKNEMCKAKKMSLQKKKILKLRKENVLI